MKLTPVMQRYVLHWGEMGTRWGVNRSVAQIQALLYLVGRPLHAEEIVETLGIARSNVSTSLRELQSLELVQLSHVMGDRRDHFQTLTEPWDILTTVVEARKHREIDPTIAMLRLCMAEAEGDEETPQEVKDRIAHMLGFVETLSGWYEEVRKLPKATLVRLMKLGAKVAKFLG